MNYTYTEITKEDKLSVVDNVITFYLEQRQILLDRMEEIQSYNKPDKVTMTQDRIEDYTKIIEALNSHKDAI
jgi:hypothetical protein